MGITARKFSLASCASVTAAVVLFLYGCSALPGSQAAIPEDQAAYNACVDHYNNTFRFLSGNKAIVSAVSPSGETHCFWSWDQQTVASAVDVAMNNCRKQYNRCFLYAANLRHETWSREISDNGGVSMEAQQQEETNMAANAAMGAFLQGLSAGMSRSYPKAIPSYTPSYTPSFGSSNAPRSSRDGGNCWCKTAQGICRLTANGQYASNC